MYAHRKEYTDSSRNISRKLSKSFMVPVAMGSNCKDSPLTSWKSSIFYMLCRVASLYYWKSNMKMNQNLKSSAIDSRP
jgi:hypothetical protein